MKINNICPATIMIGTESYGQEMSAGDPLRFRQIIKSGPHTELKGFSMQAWNTASLLYVCSKCSSVFVKQIKD